MHAIRRAHFNLLI